MDRPSESLFPHSVLEVLEHASAVPAFEQGTRSVSRSELLQLIRRLAGALAGAGMGRGRSLAIFTAVSAEAFAAQIAAHTLGCRVVGVRPGYNARQLAQVLGPQLDAVLVDAASASAELRQAAATAPLLSLGPCPGALDLLAQPDRGAALRVSAQPDDIAWLTFTSGSTGQPKGCALTYRALGAHWSWQAPTRWSPVAVQLAAGFERYMLFGTLASMVVMEFLALCLLGGGTAVIPEPDTRPLFPYAIARHRISGSIVTVPRLCQMLDVLRTEPVDVGSLRALMVSGSPLSPHRLASALEQLGPVVYHGYGQTEAGSISMLTPADVARCPERALRSVGRPHPGVEISVRDEQGRVSPATQAGELYVRSPYQMASYWALPDETSDVLRDGWLRTRDLGQLDEEGYLYLVGRTRDVIFVNAIVVYAGPIEHVLASHPGVAEAYVVGAPDDQTGEAVHAFVVPASGAALDRDALGALVRTELGEASVPRTISAVSGVPVAASGKPDKRALLDLYLPQAQQEQ
jgi:fatty-acyl-CoA synthase